MLKLPHKIKIKKKIIMENHLAKEPGRLFNQFYSSEEAKDTDGKVQKH